jgi:hydrogenase expression/formation protein HypC
MCLGIPMRLVEIADDNSGVVDLDGVCRAVGLGLLENPRIGDYVIVHAGFAIARLDPAEADARLALFEEMAEAEKSQIRSQKSE